MEKNWYKKIVQVDYAETELEKLEVIEKVKKLILKKGSTEGITFKKLDHSRLKESTE